MANKEIKLLMENWRSYVNEQQDQDVDAIARNMIQAIESSKEKIKQTAIAAMEKKAGGKLPNKNNGKKELEEIADPVSLALLGAGIVASIPEVLNLVGKIVAKFGKLETAEKLEEWHKKWHHTWIKVLINFINTITLFKFKKLDKKKQEMVAEIIYMCMVAYLLPNAIEGASHFLNASTFSAKFIAGVEAILSAIKSREIIGYLAKNINIILVTAGTAAIATGMSPTELATGAKMTGAYAKAAAGNAGAEIAKTAKGIAGKGPGIDTTKVSSAIMYPKKGRARK